MDANYALTPFGRLRMAHEQWRREKFTRADHTLDCIDSMAQAAWDLLNQLAENPLIRETLKIP